MDFMPMFGPDSAPPASAAPDAAPVPGDGAATPLTLTGRHADGDVEVMTAHAIRYGEFLARAYAAWDQALPACWVMHDDVVMEVFALACYHDATMSCDSPGLYLPQLMASTMAALDRVRSHLAAAGGADPRHPHRMAGAASRRRRAARMDAYRLWAETDGSVPPGWDGGPGLADRLTSFDWPTTPERGAQTSGILRGALGGWRDAVGLPRPSARRGRRGAGPRDGRVPARARGGPGGVGRVGGGRARHAREACARPRQVPCHGSLPRTGRGRGRGAGGGVAARPRRRPQVSRLLPSRGHRPAAHARATPGGRVRRRGRSPLHARRPRRARRGGARRGREAPVMGVAWQMAHVPDSDADIDWFLHGDPPAPTDAVPSRGRGRRRDRNRRRRPSSGTAEGGIVPLPPSASPDAGPVPPPPYGRLAEPPVPPPPRRTARAGPGTAAAGMPPPPAAGRLPCPSLPLPRPGPPPDGVVTARTRNGTRAARIPHRRGGAAGRAVDAKDDEQGGA